MWGDFVKLAIVWAALLLLFGLFSHHETLYATHVELAPAPVENATAPAAPAATMPLATSTGTFSVSSPLDQLDVSVEGPEEMGPISAALVDVGQNRSTTLEFHDQQGRTDIFRTGRVAAGTYLVRLQPEQGGESAAMPATVEVKVRRNSGGTGWLWLSLALLLIPPLVTLARSTTFESQRWAQSDPVGGSGDE
jgi:hypothetical protein